MFAGQRHIYGAVACIEAYFQRFTSAERRKLGEKARRTDSTGTSSAVGASVTENECLNREEAKKVIPVIRQLLGLETK